MKTFDEYTVRAINRYGLAGNNALARELGVNKSSISQMSAGKIYPAESTMIKLAELAGLPKEEALIDLNMWRSKDKPELQKVWQRISKMIGCFAAPLLYFSGIPGLPTLSLICCIIFVMDRKWCYFCIPPAAVRILAILFATVFGARYIPEAFLKLL